MKRNILLCTMSVIVAAVFCIGMQSCKGDDGINGSTWTGKIEEDGIFLTVTFTSDDAGTWSGYATSRYEETKRDNGTFRCKWNGTDKGTVTVKSNNLNIYHYDEYKDDEYPFVFFFTIKGNKLTIYDEDVETYYYRHDDDYIILTRQ